MSVDFGADAQGVHAKRTYNIRRFINDLRAILRAFYQLDQWQQVDRVEWMRHEDLPRTSGTFLEFRRLVARGGRANDSVRGAVGLNLCENFMLYIKTFRCAFLNPFGICNCFGDGGMETQRSLWRQSNIE